ncbi:DUF4214 domain-containing protein [Massilia sp. NR 4-1]|uniref:DUF4214 domain-containing protein n=1 Tax=Massilia sp. NR 4-1 TaxID=1678028 RepID=UPI00067D731F|nr:DUF4214 domain-containing protein [Massilia sp. NR 4-1]
MADEKPVYLNGTTDNDVLYGGAGNDGLEGNGGYDRLFGGDGDDVLRSGNFYDEASGLRLPDKMGDVLDGGAGNDHLFGAGGRDLLLGGAGDDELRGDAGDDLLLGGEGNDLLDGGSGLDRAQFAAQRADYSLAKNGEGYTVTHGTESDVTLGVERLVFSDRAVAFDLEGNAGQIYRVYQAALNRAPDLGGLGFWINAADLGVSMLDVAAGFTHSAEFARLYGNSVSNEAFLNQLYLNALHRQPDQGGFNFWLGVLDSGISRESVLLGFADSPENHAQVIGSIQNGIEYIAA